MSQTKIYLSGPVEKAENPESWRDELIREYSYFNFYHPTKAHEFTLPLDEAEKYMMVMTQLRQINLSDILLVRYYKEETWGTPVEMFWAYTCGVPVVVWNASNSDEIPAYVSVFADGIDASIEKCIRMGEKMI